VHCTTKKTLLNNEKIACSISPVFFLFLQQKNKTKESQQHYSALGA
jgi:hypothetical protein